MDKLEYVFSLNKDIEKCYVNINKILKNESNLDDCKELINDLFSIHFISYINVDFIDRKIENFYISANTYVPENTSEKSSTKIIFEFDFDSDYNFKFKNKRKEFHLVVVHELVHSLQIDNNKYYSNYLLDPFELEAFFIECLYEQYYFNVKFEMTESFLRYDKKGLSRKFENYVLEKYL